MSWRILCLWCCLLSSVCAQEAADAAGDQSAGAEGDGEEVTGRSSSSFSTHRRLTLVCDAAIEQFQDLLDLPGLTDVYSNFKKDLQARQHHHFFQEKIVPNHRGSVCQNLNVTCCKPTMEKTSEILSRDEYKLYYDDIFQSHSKTCRSPGKLFHESSLLVIRQLVKELEVRVNHSLGMTLPLDTFKDLSNFLISFSSVPDICRLPDLLDSQTQTLIDLMLTSLFGEDEDYSQMFGDPASMRCARNISSSLIRDHQQRIQTVMQKHLTDLSLLSQSFKLAHETINTMRRHTLSRSCTVAITRMRYCPLCGGYGKFKPCLFKCINTLRGCFADLAEIQSDFLGLISAARLLSEDLIEEMGPDTFDKSYLNNFVLMVQELREKEELLRETLVLECSITSEQNGTNDTSTLVRRKRGGSLIQPIQGSKSRPKQDPLLEQLDPEVLATVVEAEMGCLERVADRMKDASDDICFVSRYNVAHKGNTQCWTGSVLGRYDHPKAGFLKADQLKNPEYADIPLTIELRYGELINTLHVMTKNINNYKVCLDSDDEDCFQNPFQHCGPPEVSGSGSGSGSDSDSGINETATEYNSGFVATTTTRPVTVSTMMAIPLDNNLRDQMLPSSSTIPPSSTTPTNGDRETDKDPRLNDFDNTVPVGPDRNKISGPVRNPPEPLGGKDTSTGRPEVQVLTTIERRATTTGSDTTTTTTTAGLTTARVEEEATDRRVTMPAARNPPTSSAATSDETDQITILRPSGEILAISSSASPHQTPLLTTAFVTYLALIFLH